MMDRTAIILLNGKEESLNTINTEEDLLNTTYAVNVQESDTVKEESFVRKRKKTWKTTRLEQKCSTNKKIGRKLIYW